MNFYDFTSHFKMGKIVTKKKRMLKRVDPMEGAMLDVLEKAKPTEYYSGLIELYEKNPQALIRMGCPPNRIGNELAMLQSEKLWYLFGQPYYKVYPEMVDMMTEVSLDIPYSQLAFPYPAFVVRFPCEKTTCDCRARWAITDERGNKVDHDLRPKSMLVASALLHNDDSPQSNFALYNSLREYQEKAKDTENYRACVSLRYDYDLNRLPPEAAKWVGEDKELYSFQFVFGADRQYDRDTPIEQLVELASSKTEAHTMRSVLPSAKEWMPAIRVIRKLIRVAVCTAFFGLDCHEMVMPDLTRKKLQRRITRNMDKEKKQNELKRMQDEWKNDKKVGWTIGHEVVLPRPEVVTTQEDESDDGEKRQLKHSHMRRGYMRWQRKGEGLKQRELIFIHPTMVRPDLPLNPQRGYKIKT